MKQRRVFSCLLSLLLCACMVAGMLPGQVLAVALGPVEGLEATGYKVVSSKDYALAPGVTETDILLNDATGDAQVAGFMTTITAESLAAGQVTLAASYKGFYKGTVPSEWKVTKWGLETTTGQAAAYEAATGKNVVAATNGDFFNMQTGQPSGVLIMNGVNCNPDKTAAEPYFAILKDGTPVIRAAGTPVDDVQEAVSGPFWLVRDGQVVVSEDNSLIPTNSIGMTADGDIVTFLADGRQYPYSVGFTTYRVACFLKEQGVVNALYLDGGGSATYASQREGSDTLMVQNSPSDGVERTVSSALLIVSNLKADGNFHHAAISSDSSAYMPGCTVQFTARGVDSAGGKANLPEGVTWALAAGSEAYGSIDPETGLFTSNGTVGAVTVQMKQGDIPIGSATVEFKEPDQVYFGGATISVDFGKSSDLGLVVKADDVAMPTSTLGMVWEVPEGLGTMNGNIFTSASGTEPISGTIKVTYTPASGEPITDTIIVEVGKLPVVVFDFEADPVTGKVPQSAHYHWGKTQESVSNVWDENDNPAPTVTSVEVITSGKYTDSPVTATVTAPFAFTGNFHTSVPAADIFAANGYSFYAWPNDSLPPPQDGQTGSMAVKSEDEGGQVRFGEYALEFNYDYASYDKSQNSNFYMRYCGEDIVIDGAPSEMGVWVYADERAYGFVFYIQIEVWNGTGYSTLYYPLQHDGNGDGVIDANDNKHIDFTGWKYLRAAIEPDKISNCTPEHPIIIQSGQGFLWLSYQPGNGMAGRYAGSVYFDDLRVSYGTNLDDLDNPIIDSVTINGTELMGVEEIPTITTNDVEIYGFYHDYDGANRSGIDFQKATIEVDDEIIASDNSTEQILTRFTMSNGLHSIKVTTYDEFGNSASEICYVNVEAPGVTADNAKLAGADTVTMGSTYDLTLSTVGTVKTVVMDVTKVNSDFGEPTVQWAEGWSGTVTYKFAGFKRAAITIEASHEEGAAGDIATLSFNVPSTLDPEIDFFTYRVSKCATTNPADRGYTCAQPDVKLSLSAYYTVTAGVAIAGKTVDFLVIDMNGDPAANVPVKVNGVQAGVTDENGKLENITVPDGASFTLVADDGAGHVSFITTVSIMTAYAELAPVGISLPAGDSSSTTQTITWLAGIDAAHAAVVKYSTATAKEGEPEAEVDVLVEPASVTGVCTVHDFTVDKKAALTNSVTLTGLEPGTTYYYQVGDGGENWSPIHSFTTVAQGDTTNFFVIGDTQMSGDNEVDAEALGYLNALGQIAVDFGSHFGLQTGDYVDNGGDLAKWIQIQDVFHEAYDGIPVVHTNGNHEYYGDAEGKAAQLLLNQDATGWYSYEMGNVYIAVIHNAANMDEALEWLKADAAASDAAWKVLSVHEPVFYTNTGSASKYHLTVPAAVEEAGIDVVFSGHDHSYARKVVEDGAVYFICGDLGEKSRNLNYKANDNGFEFDKISQEYEALCLLVSAQAVDDDGTYTMEIKVVDTANPEEPIDSYTITKKGACYEGHTWSSYNSETLEVTCSVCDVTIPATESYHNGLLPDSVTGGHVLLVGGISRIGHVDLNGTGTHYYMDTDGFAYEGEYELCGEICVFDDGLFVSSSNADVVIAGLAGPSVEFVLYKDGKFVLDGSGAMYNYHGHGGERPWFEFRNDITTVVVGADITEIGRKAFRKSSCTTIVFESGSKLVKINDAAFYESKLRSITLPESVTYLGEDSFTGCYSLTNMYLPDDISGIHDRTFAWGTNSVVLSVKADSYAEEWAAAHGVSYTVRGGWQPPIVLPDPLPQPDPQPDPQPEPEPEPQPELGDTAGWSGIQDELKELTTQIAAGESGTGETVVVEMNGVTSVPEEVLTEISGQDVNVSFEMGEDLVWTINGQDIPQNVKDLDLGVEVGGSYIPEGVIDEITNGTVSTQIELSHDGAFGTTVTLTLHMGVEHRGLWANLYHYDNGKLVFRHAARIDADGYAGWPFDHASSYVVVVDHETHNPDWTNPFTDVPEASWYFDAVEFMNNNGMMEGTSSTTFEPMTKVSRGMLVTLLYRLECSPEVTYVSEFTDVPDGQWFSDGVSWAHSVGLVEGVGDGTYCPNRNITREELTTLLHRYSVYKGYDTSAEQDLARFTDADHVSSWAKDALEWATAEGLVNGRTATTLAPNEGASRAEAAQLMMQFLRDYLK